MSISSTTPRLSTNTEVSIEIKETKINSSKHMLLPINREVSFTPNRMVNNIDTALEILKNARTAELEGDEKRLTAYDTALSEFCSSNRRVSNLMKDRKNILLIARLDLPKTKAQIIRIQNQHSQIFNVENDKGTPFADALEGRLTDRMLRKMRERAEGLAKVEGQQAEQDNSLNEFAQQLLDSGPAAKKIISEKTPNDHFILMLYLLKKPEYFRLIPLIFNSLIDMVTKGETTPELNNDLVQVAQFHPQIRMLLACGEDAVILQVLNPETHKTEQLNASRFLLAARCGYFQGLLTKESLSEFQKSADAPVFDLQSTRFDMEIMSMLLRWLRDPHLVSFMSDTKSSLSRLEHFLTHFSALYLTNESEFIEKIQLDLSRELNEENLQDTLRLALRYKLPLTIACCIEFIDAKGLEIQIQEDGNLKIRQKKEVDISSNIYKTVSLLEGRVNKAVISKTTLEKETRCNRINRSFGLLGRNTVKLGSTLLGYFGDSIRRTGLCYLAIWGIQKAANISPWPAWKTFCVSYAVASTAYPCITTLFHKCIFDRFTNDLNYTLSVDLPHMIPMRLQRAFFSSVEKVKSCLRKITHRDQEHFKLLMTSYPLLKNIPKSIVSLNLSEAEDLTDGVLEELVQRHSNLEELTIGSHPYLTEEGLNHLRNLKQLKRLRICLKDGQSPGILNQLDLVTFFGELKPFRIDLEVSDTTIAYYPLEFLYYVPSNAEVRIFLNHVPIPPSLVCLEPVYQGGVLIQWPQFFDRLAESCPSLTHLDCGDLLIVDTNLETIATNCRKLRSLKTINNAITDRGIEALIRGCTQLEEIYLEGSKISNDSIEFMVDHAVNLQKITLSRCPRLTNPFCFLLTFHPNIEVVRLEKLHIDDEGIQFLLDSDPPFQELTVKQCSQVSNRMYHLISQRPSQLKNDKMQRVKNLTNQVDKSPIPMVLGRKSLPPILFRFLIDNFNVGPENNPHDNLGRVLREGLGLSAQPKLLVRLSQIEALASLPLLELLKRFKFIKSNFVQVDDDSPYNSWEDQIFFEYIEYHLKFVAPKWFPKIELAYKEFLSESFSENYLKSVDELAKAFLIEFKTALTPHKEQLEFIFPVFYADIRRGVRMFRELTAGLSVPLLQFLESIKKFGDENKWTDEQKIAACLAPLFTDLTWINDYFFPVKEPVAEAKSEAVEDEKEQRQEEEHKYETVMEAEHAIEIDDEKEA